MSVVDQARSAAARLVRSLGAEPDELVAPASPRIAGPGLLERARFLAELNDAHEAQEHAELFRDYLEAPAHDAAYWRRELEGKIRPETLALLLRSLGLK